MLRGTQRMFSLLGCLWVKVEDSFEFFLQRQVILSLTSCVASSISLPLSRSIEYFSFLHCKRSWRLQGVLQQAFEFWHCAMLGKALQWHHQSPGSERNQRWEGLPLVAGDNSTRCGQRDCHSQPRGLLWMQSSENVTSLQSQGKGKESFCRVGSANELMWVNYLEMHRS